MSSVGWIDFSSEHRERVRTVIDLLSVPGVLDELGIGVVRDTLADRMFPGISTIQTRAKYFILTALLIRDFIDRGGKRETLESFLRYHERECRIRLVEHHGEGRRSLGIIGSTFGSDRRRDVTRRPSSIYWTGLRLFGIVHPPNLSLAEFSRLVSGSPKQLRSIVEAQGKESGDDPDADVHDLRPRIETPETTDDYWDSLTITLLHGEAVFLREQVKAHQPNSLLGRILMDDDSLEQVANFQPEPDDDDGHYRGFESFTELPAVRRAGGRELQAAIQHARDFWLLLEGAHIRYNCLIQERLGTKERRDEFENRWDKWRGRIADFPKSWDSHFMWQLVSSHGSQPKPITRQFIDGWIEETRRGADNVSRCDELVIRQERFNKGNRARLRPGNTDAVNGWVGIDRLDYRLGVVLQFLRDIRDGETNGGNGDA